MLYVPLRTRVAEAQKWKPGVVITRNSCEPSLISRDGKYCTHDFLLSVQALPPRVPRWSGEPLN